MSIWGPGMEDEMSSDMRDHETVAAAFDWLYADGPAATPQNEDSYKRGFKAGYEVAVSGAAQPSSGRDESTDHIDWDILAEERLGQRPRSEHGRHIPQTSPAPGCDSGSHLAQASGEPE